MESIPFGDGTIVVGTCGYSYKDWVGPFYPQSIKSNGMLPYYAERFPAVEIDASYYRVPSEATFASMDARTPADFRFAAKLPASRSNAANSVRPRSPSTSAIPGRIGISRRSFTRRRAPAYSYRYRVIAAVWFGLRHQKRPNA